jgi:hypothetical protein
VYYNVVFIQTFIRTLREIFLTMSKADTCNALPNDYCWEPIPVRTSVPTSVPGAPRKRAIERRVITSVCKRKLDFGIEVLASPKPVIKMSMCSEITHLNTQDCDKLDIGTLQVPGAPRKPANMKLFTGTKNSNPDVRSCNRRLDF